MTMRAIWHDVVLAESDETVVVEGNHYFPHESLREEYFHPSKHRTVCPWKGVASYYSVSVDREINPDAAWEYESPSVLARQVKGRVAFWHGVSVVSVDSTDERAVSSGRMAAPARAAGIGLNAASACASRCRYNVL